MSPVGWAKPSPEQGLKPPLTCPVASGAYLSLSAFPSVKRP